MHELSHRHIALSVALAAVALPWAFVAASLTSLSTVLLLNVATVMLVSAALRSVASGQSEPSIAQVLYEAEYESDSYS